MVPHLPFFADSPGTLDSELYVFTELVNGFASETLDVFLGYVDL